MNDTVKYLLDESRIPKTWYNLQADLPRPLPPVLHPGTQKPVGPDDLAPLFPMALIMQEVTTERDIEIPEPVRDVYRQWRPTPPANAAFGSVFWAQVRPFVLSSPLEVPAPGPLAIDSVQYAKEIDEVRRLGARDSKERSADQTSAAIFSLIKGTELWSAAARAAAAAKRTSPIENARIFALMSLATMDATIAGWAIKKQHPLWRPITAIREARANADPNWEPLLVTPPHPDYVSGHCITSGASSRVLAMLFGNDGVRFSATYGGGFGLTRSYSGFTHAEKEIEDARVWAGIHTRSADVDGGIVGHKIAELVVQRAMTPLAVKSAS